MSKLKVLWVLCWTAALCLNLSEGMVAFEKLTEYDYRGNVYYTIKNLTLYECQGWCREEPECQAATFSFVVNPLVPIQQTICLLQNETAANNPSATPQRAYNTYYMVKLRIRSDNVCQRPWTFERVPNKMIKGLDNALIFTSTKEACLAACLNEQRFVCRSAEYNYVTLQCHLSEYDRRSIEEFIDLVDTQGVDYFENLCLNSNEGCKGKRDYEVPQLGIPETQVSRFVSVNYYVDKELMASNQVACERACQIENEFLCRSFLYKGPPDPSGYNCQLFHLDHVSLPDGSDTYLSPDRPLIDVGDRVGSYYENACQKPTNHMICKQVVTRDKQDKAYITQIMCYEKPIPRQSDNEAIIVTNSGSSLSGPDKISPSEGLGQLTSLGSQGSSGGQTVSQQGSQISGQNTGGYGSKPIGSGGAYGGSNTGGTAGEKQTNEIGNDVNCDNSGLCYDVSVHCKDTKIQVNVNTNRPFNGRIYALGRSETCNVDVINSDAFRLDLTMTGQDCNTQSASGVFTNTIVVQHHSVVMTKTDKIYKIRCTYDMTSKNITFGMMPISVGEFHSSDQSQTGGYLKIRDPDMISITSAPEAPPPRIRILDGRKKEVETVRIGDKLTFRIEIPDNTPYGIFARSCVAMAKDSRSTFQIIDDEGCSVDPSIFPRFTPDGLALQSVYEAFRFTESYGVIFQCNVRYCLGPCEPATCQWGRETYESWGKRKRRDTGKTADVQDAEDMTLSQEILVLDFDEEKIDPFTSTRTGSEAFGFEEDSVSIATTCPTKTSVLALAVTCALLLLIYVCTVFYFLMKKYINPRKSIH